MARRQRFGRRIVVPAADDREAAMAGKHHFAARITWTGAVQGPTRSYDSYARDYLVEIEGKPPLAGSSDPAFRGDASRHNPEDLLVASLSACHLLWYLHLCADTGIEVVRGHQPTRDLVLDPPRIAPYVAVVLERHRRHRALPVADLAVRLDDRRHVAREGDVFVGWGRLPALLRLQGGGGGGDEDRRGQRGRPE